MVLNLTGQAARDAQADFAASDIDLDSDKFDDEKLEAQPVFVEPKPKFGAPEIKTPQVIAKPKQVVRAGVESIISPASMQKTRVRSNILTEQEIMSLEPKDSESASKFLRNKTLSVMSFYPDRDELRITIKGTDADEDKYKHQATVEINVFNQHEREKKYIEAAHMIWQDWASIEREKFEK